MIFKIHALKNFAIFIGKHLCWSLFLIKLQTLRCFPVNIAKFLRAAFYIEPFQWLLLQMMCFTLYFQKDVAEYIVAIHYIVVSFWNLKSISFAFVCFHSLCYSLSFVIPLVAIRYHLLSLGVPFVCLFINDHLFEHFHFHIKFIYFTYKKFGCSY